MKTPPINPSKPSTSYTRTPKSTQPTKSSSNPKKPKASDNEAIEPLLSSIQTSEDIKDSFALFMKVLTVAETIYVTAIGTIIKEEEGKEL